MRLDRVVELLAPCDVVGFRDVDVRDLAYDTRALREGALFFCVPGERADGHDRAGEAAAAGATALVVERPLAVDLPQVVVPSVRSAMPAVAVDFFGRPSEELAVAGITGTNGKTTTAYLLHSILEAAGQRPGLLGNIERRVGAESRPSGLNTPEAIDLQRLLREMVEAGDRSCVLEASSHASEKRRLDGVRFASLAFTNLTRDHLDFHGTMERYFEAKRRLFTEHEPAPAAAVNVGDEWGRRLADELRRLDRAPLLTYGVTPDAELSTHPALERSRLVGSFNVENVLAAAAISQLVGVPEEAIADGVASVGGVPGRFESVDEGQRFSVIVDYAHKPGALEAVLRTARQLTNGRLICVVGAGGDRDRGKRPLMGRVATELSDLTIVTSDNPRSEDPLAIIEEILTGVVGPAEVELDRREAIARAAAEAGEEDVVVIAGRGAEQYQDVAGEKIPFDDREVVREAIRRLRAPA
jgi:UDP-N-acetylmuramoyl-L-alanyl-D-glutamate--2,6-diaminopimelate ligase